MSKKELEDKLICKVFDIEQKLNELADLFKDSARLLMRLQDSEVNPE